MAAKATCSVEGCNKPAYCRSWCTAHYARWQKRGTVDAATPLIPYSYDGALCSISGCNQSIEARGWCKMHYNRWWKHGDPSAVLPTTYRDGRTMLDGYVLVWAPTHPLVKGNGYIAEHGSRVHFRAPFLSGSSVTESRLRRRG